MGRSTSSDSQRRMDENQGGFEPNRGYKIAEMDFQPRWENRAARICRCFRGSLCSSCVFKDNGQRRKDTHVVGCCQDKSSTNSTSIVTQIGTKRSRFAHCSPPTHYGVPRPPGCNVFCLDGFNDCAGMVVFPPAEVENLRSEPDIDGSGFFAAQFLESCTI